MMTGGDTFGASRTSLPRNSVGARLKVAILVVVLISACFKASSGLSERACGLSSKEVRRRYLLGLSHTMSYGRSKLTNIKHSSLTVQVNQ